MILFKEIKPKRFKEAAFRAALIDEMRKVGEDIKRSFNQTTATWKNRPEFEVVMALKHGPEVFVWTDDEIYGYVSGGTEEHVILPVNAQALRFREGFIPKTRPGTLVSVAGAQFGKVIMTAGVIHPGTKPRDFDKQVKAKWEKPFKRRMEQAMKRAAKASGHAI